MKLLTQSGEHELSEAEMQAYRMKFPTFDEQLGDIAVWLVGNPSRRPKCVHRFLMNWLKKPYRSKKNVVQFRNIGAEKRASTIASLTGRFNREEYIDVTPTHVARIG